MICPICGFEMQEEKTCEKCGWVAEETKEAIDQQETNALEVEPEVNSEEVQGLDVDLQGIEDAEEVKEVEDEFASTDEDLVIDFDEIDNNVVKEVPKSNSWAVSLVSFLAGVLATLVVIGCFDGTIVKQFDKLSNGTPYEVIESYCNLNFGISLDSDEMINTYSPYLRAQVVNNIEYYNQMTGATSELDLDVDVTKDEEFKDIAKYYLDTYFEGSNQTVKINKLDFTDVEYYKSGSEEFEAYLSEYKSGAEELANADNVSVFANVIFDLSFEVTTMQEQTTAIPETTKKKNKKNKAEQETTTMPTQAPTTKKESADVQCSVVCVKVDNSWYIFKDMQALS